jgi:hypothetical protein
MQVKTCPVIIIVVPITGTLQYPNLSILILKRTEKDLIYDYEHNEYIYCVGLFSDDHKGQDWIQRVMCNNLPLHYVQAQTVFIMKLLIFLGGGGREVKGGRRVGWQTHRHQRADCLENMGATTSHNPMGLHGLLQG